MIHATCTSEGSVMAEGIFAFAGRTVVLVSLVSSVMFRCGDGSNESRDTASLDVRLDLRAGEAWSLPDAGSADLGTVDSSGTEDLNGAEALAVEITEVEADTGLDCEPGAGTFGCPCQENGDCVSGYCGFHLGDQVCAQGCVDTCDPGWKCKPISASGSDVHYVCISDFPHLCLPCDADEGCRLLTGSPDVCVRYGEAEGSFCGGACEVTTDCPAGYLCFDALTIDGSPVRQCVSTSGTCACSTTAIASAFSTPCAVSSEWGTCPSTRVCTAGGLTPCDARTPAEEICYNDLDDDCDGLVDSDDEEQCEVPCICGDGACEPDRCGESWEAGAKTCATDCAVCGNGKCDPGEGTVKCPADCCGSCGDGVCKGGECGEGPVACPQDCTDYSCGDGLCDPAENAIDCHDDCEPYECDNHTCEPGEDATSCPPDCSAVCGDCECAGGEDYGTCPADCGFCGDGYCLADCSALAEDAATCPVDCCMPSCAASDGSTKQCGSDGCGGLCGQCVSGYECSALGTCVCAVMGDDADCNGVDDDCNGAVDDHFPVQATTCGKGVCEGTGERGCADGQIIDSCLAGEPSGDDANCDGLDDDCDGAMDEHFVSAPTACGIGACAQVGQTLCIGGEESDSCLAAAPADEECNGVDDDCDGLTDGDDQTLATTACEKQQGVCAGAQKPAVLCVDGAWRPCDEAIYLAHDPTYEPDEATCDDLDNDCDGISEPAEATLVAPDCENQVGVCSGCKKLSSMCSGGAWQACGPTHYQTCSADYQTPETSCDGEDNDCDGVAEASEETLAVPDCESQAGVCSGCKKSPAMCVGGLWQTCSEADRYRQCNAIYAASEVRCDNKDEDCNGLTDEGCDDDSDGYCDVGLTYVGSTRCPNGAGDCCDISGLTRPDAVGWYNDKNECDSWDYNCNASIDLRYTKSGYCSTVLNVCYPKEGWNGSGDYPYCGQLGDWRLFNDCNNHAGSCAGTVVSRYQYCH
jgi:hypothetical protein